MIFEERDKRIILKIRDYCQRIMEAKERFGATLEEYRADADYRDVVCMNLFQIGEASKYLSEDVKEKLKDIPWSEIYGMRNLLAHAYIKVDDKIVWDVVEKDVPDLEKILKTTCSN